MRIVTTAILFTVLSSPLVLCAQAPSAVVPPQPIHNTAPSDAMPAAPAPPPASPAPSSLLQPSLDEVRQTLSTIKVDRWKRGSVRDEANTDINSIMVDMQQRVPNLLKDADAAPGSLSKSLPVSRHIDALYDVLLRVVEASRMAAPDDQASQLRAVLTDLGKARLALDDSMERSASSQEKLLGDLRVTVQKQAAFKCPAPPPPPECPKPAVRKPVRKKPAATPPAGTGQGAGQKTTSPGATPQKPSATQPKTGP
ncbi:MAG TPA: hypothetical protein VHZ28_02485 [Terracidiphilus sp.]|nr:hypothetical protein [Terracidiphilus sp.]HEX4283931.1 hypothetical protein [Terracidiphilus sp.]